MIGFTFCVECTRRLRDAIFCRYCGASACSWDCYVRHYVAEHSVTPSFPRVPFVSEADPAGLDGRHNSAQIQE
jgi:hypothetical protein